MDARPVASHRVLRVFSIVFAIMTALAIGDQLLIRSARAHREHAGQQLFERAERLRASAKAADALPIYRAALTQSPHNAQYQLAFVQALYSAGQISEAEAAAAELLNRFPDSGEANLAMARILSKAGRAQQATWYYHRAIYGSWAGDAVQERVRTRFELAALLAALHANQELVAELLLLEAEGPKDYDTRMRIARLYLDAQAWSQAAALFKEITRERPRDAAAWAGLGDADYGLERYWRAAYAYRQAAELGVNDPKNR